MRKDWKVKGLTQEGSCAWAGTRSGHEHEGRYEPIHSASIVFKQKPYIFNIDIAPLPKYIWMLL